ncbi:17397_t:CDS:1, partial [Dentiscutata erythropus]
LKSKIMRVQPQSNCRSYNDDHYSINQDFSGIYAPPTVLFMP